MRSLVRLLLSVVLACSGGLGVANADPGVPVFSLANVYREGVVLSDYWVSEKLDGVRALWDGEAFYSRRGNRFPAPAWFVRGFPTVSLDGELWMGRGTFEALSGAVRRREPGDDDWRAIRFMVFDLPGHAGTFDARLRQMRELVGRIDSAHIGLVEQSRTSGHAELMTRLRQVVAEGGEGLMLRLGSSRHSAARSQDLLKVKLHEDAEAVVIAHSPGKGKYRGMLGALLVEAPDGRRFKLGSGFSDAERRHPPAVGATVTYRHRGLTARGLPRFASFVRIREDI